MNRHLVRAIAVLFICAFSNALSATEFVAIVDTDRNTTTGCVLHGVPGAEVSATTALAPAGDRFEVRSTTISRCIDGAWGPVSEIPGGWPVAADGESFSIETALPYSLLGIPSWARADFSFVIIREGSVAQLLPTAGRRVTFGTANARRRSAPPSGGGQPPAADGVLSDWQLSEPVLVESGVKIWMRGGSDALVLRFDLRSARPPVAVDDEYVVGVGGALTIAKPGVLGNDSDPDGDPLAATLIAPSVHGQVSLSPEGAFEYRHNGDPAAAVDQFTYRATDGFSTSGSATVTILAVPTNDQPVANADSYSTAEDTPLVVGAPGVLANDTDGDGDALEAVLLTPPSSGTLQLMPDGSFTFTPATNFNGTLTFSYMASDASQNSLPVTVTITVTPVDDAPTAGADQVTVGEGGVAVFDARANDVDPEGAALTITIVTPPAHGTLVLGVNQSFTYTHDGSETTTDSFTYSVSDGSLGSNVATVTITVTPVNDGPVATADVATVNEGASLAIPVLANDTDPDSTLVPQIATLPAHGTVTVDASGTVTYTHDGSETTSDSFTYAAFDGSLASPVVSVSITVVPLNDAPVAVNDTASVNEGQSVTINVLQNDSDADSPSMTPSVVTPPAHGTATVNGDGTITYVHDGSETTSDSFTYQDSDGSASGNIATVTVTITPVNDQPTFTSGGDVTVNEDSGIHSAAWATAISAGAGETQALTFTVTGNTNAALFATAPSIAADGTLTFTPATNANGSAAITVVLMDDGGVANGGLDTSAPVTFTVTVNAVNDAPTFNLPAAAPAVLEDSGAQSVAAFANSILAGPADEAGQTLSFSVTTVAADPTLSFSVSPSIDATGALTYTPAPNAYGTATFDVVLTDGGSAVPPNVNASVTKQFTITVNAVNDPPSFAIAGDPPASNEDGGPQTINGFAASISQGPNESGQALTFLLTSLGTSGNLAFTSGPSITASGILTYTAAANTNGTATFSAILTDDGGGSDTSSPATFTITVDAVNDAPTFTLPANAPAIAEDAGPQTVSGFASAISAGPSDEAGQVLSFSVTLISADPSLTFTAAPSINAATGDLTYTAAANAYGTATFNVVLTDNGSGVAPNVNTSVARQFTITVNAVNDPPSFVIAANPFPSLEDAGPQTVGGFASSVSQGAGETGQTLTFTLTPAGSTGTLAFTAAPAIAADGTLTYTAAADTNGTATFSVVLTDNGGGADTSATATFTITVVAINDAPTFTLPASAPAVNEDSGAQTVNSFVTDLVAGPADESAQTFTFAVSPVTVDSTLIFTAAPAIDGSGNLTYFPAPNAYGSATFNVFVMDSGSIIPPHVNTSVTKQFTITVNPVNDEPSFTIAANPPASDEDGGAQNVPAFASAISQGAGETGQTLTFQLTPDGTTGTLAFSAAPAIDPSGVLTYTAAANTNGTATFKVVLVDDGGTTNGGDDTSAEATFTITVNSVNDAPTFTLPATAPASSEDAGPQTVAAFATAISAGPADEAGQGLTLTVTQASADPTLTFTTAPSVNVVTGTLTYTAAPNAYGSATFDVVLADDGSNAAPNANTSVTKQFTITVNPVNDAPTAVNDTYSYPTDGSSLSVAAPGVLANDVDIDSATLTATLVSGVAEGTLSLQPDGSFTFTKAPAGTLTSVTFTYTTSDGGATSLPATVTITINSPPVAVADSFSGFEDTTLNAGAPGLLANDGDPDGNIALIQAVSGPDCSGYPANGCGTLTIGLAMDGSFFYTPPANFNGVVTFTYKLVDGGGLESAPATVTMTLTAVNDAPSFDVDIVDPQAPRNTSVVTIPNVFSNILRGPADESGQSLTFETEVWLGSALLKPFVDLDSGIASTSGIHIDSTGTLRVGTNSSTGNVLVTVRLIDDGGTDNGGQDTSDSVDITIKIVSVNQAPTFTVTNLTINEDAGAQSINPWVTGISAGTGESQTVTMSVVSNDNNALFTVQPTIVSNTRLNYTPAPNANGVATLTIRAKDNGGTANGGVDTTEKTATITINAVNDKPSFTKGANLSYALMTGPVTEAGWATAISPGPADESAQTVSFQVTVVSGGSVFSVAPAISPTGDLTFTFNGTAGLATISVVAVDTGSNTAPSSNTSAAQTFTINSGNVNSAPSFVKGADVTVLEDSGAASYSGWATSISPGPAADAGQVVSFTVTNNNNTLFSSQPAISSTGDLTFTPAANRFGTATVTVTAVDNGGTANGGSNTSASQTFTITVTAVNDAPSLTLASATVTRGENGGLQTIASFASTTPGTNETGQTPFTYTVTKVSGADLFTAAGGVAPAINASGTLTFTAGLSQSGSAVYSVTVRDAGGTSNGGVDTSSAQTFTITITTGGPSLSTGDIAFSAYANIPLTVGTLPGEATYNLLTGASDPDTPLSVLISSKPNNARVDVASDGSFTFRSGDLSFSAGSIQPQSFKWRVCDAGGNCSAERTATVSFIGPLIYFSDATAAAGATYALDAPGKGIPSGHTTSAAPAATYIIKSGTYSMGVATATTQLAIRAGDKVYGQGIPGLTLASLGVSQAALTVGTLPALPDYSTGTTPTLYMPDPATRDANGNLLSTPQSPIFKGYGGGLVKNLKFDRAREVANASWILFSNSSWTSLAGDYVFENVESIKGQGFAVPQVGSTITVRNSKLVISDGFGLNGGSVTVENTPIELKLVSEVSASAITLFSDFDSTTSGTMTVTIDANSPITINNNNGNLFSLTTSNAGWMPTGPITVNSDLTITRTGSTAGLVIKLMSNVSLNGKVTVTTATGKPLDLQNLTNFSMPNAANLFKMNSTTSTVNPVMLMSNVTVNAAGVTLPLGSVGRGALSFTNTEAAPSGPITVPSGTIVGTTGSNCSDLVLLNAASNVTVSPSVLRTNCF